MRAGGEYTYAGLSASLCRGALERPWLPLSMWKAFFQRSLTIGVRATPTVFLMAFCVGSVLAMVLVEQLQELSMEETVPRLIWIILNQQLAPMLAAVVFIGRSVSGSAAELANMKVGEEIKALETMGVDVSRYLLLPVLGAFLVMLPVMEIYTVGVGLLGAHGVCSLVMGMDGKQFVLRALVPPRMQDALIGVGKSVVFAVVVAMIAFRKGLNATGGSDAVGRVATAAVVSSLAAVTLVNAVITGLQNVLIAAQLINK
jgi:phospholipid/cholesterol/gamma-HCH transport system permease protein